MKIVKAIAPKPTLPENALTGITLFSGIGAVEAGWIDAGIRPVLAIEKDPKRPNFSKALVAVQQMNYGEYGHVALFATVQEVVFKAFGKKPFIVHSSPPCGNFSLINNERQETQEDITGGEATARAIAELQPIVFTLEQVPEYWKSKSIEPIFEALDENNYDYIPKIIDLGDYGIPQKPRRRLFLVATKNDYPLWKFPVEKPQTSWYNALHDIKHALPRIGMDELTIAQQDLLEAFLYHNLSNNLLIARMQKYKRSLTARDGAKPAFTILRSFFTDDKGSSRHRFLDALIDGHLRTLDLRAIARLCTVPDWVSFPDVPAISGAALGNCVPSSFICQLVEENLAAWRMRNEIIPYYTGNLAVCSD